MQIEITELNAYEISREGRTRWHIENETFNTLKNQGYHFEHNFGHGYKNLSSVFAMLMMLAFLIDQAEQLCCGLFHGEICQAFSLLDVFGEIANRGTKKKPGTESWF